MKIDRSRFCHGKIIVWVLCYLSWLPSSVGLQNSNSCCNIYHHCRAIALSFVLFTSLNLRVFKQRLQSHFSSIVRHWWQLRCIGNCMLIQNALLYQSNAVYHHFHKHVHLGKIPFTALQWTFSWIILAPSLWQRIYLST